MHVMKRNRLYETVISIVFLMILCMLAGSFTAIASSPSVTDFRVNSDGTLLLSYYCNNNVIKNIDVSEQHQLNAFFCNDNKLTSLDVAGLTNLDEIIVWWSTNQPPPSTVTNFLYNRNTGDKESIRISCGKNLIYNVTVSDFQGWNRGHRDRRMK